MVLRVWYCVRPAFEDEGAGIGGCVLVIYGLSVLKEEVGWRVPPSWKIAWCV